MEYAVQIPTETLRHEHVVGGRQRTVRREFWLPSKRPDVDDMAEAIFAARIWGLMAVVGYLGAWLSSLQADKAAAADAKATDEGVS